MRKIVFLYSLLFIAFASCSTQEDEEAVNVNPNTQLVKKTVFKSYSLSSSENPSGLVTTDWYYSGMKLASTYSSDGVRKIYTYTGDLITKIVEIRDGITKSYSFEYNAEEDLTAVYFGSTIHETYTYNGDGTITAVHNSANPEFSYTLTFYLTNNEISKVDTVYGNGFQTTHEYAYDNHFSPTKNIIGYDKLYPHVRESYGNYQNVKTRAYTDSDGNVGTVNKTIKYNSLGFPTVVYSRDDQVIDSYDTQFFYQ